MSADYAFESRWTVPAATQRCWPFIERALQPQASWWPGVTVTDPPARLAVGEELTLRVRSPLGYTLRMRLRLTDVQHGVRIAAASTGDLEGHGSIELHSTAADTTVIITRWNVRTRRRWMTASARLLRPVFVTAHDRVMLDGERALRAAVAAS